MLALLPKPASAQSSSEDQVRLMHYNLLFYGQDNCRSLNDKNTYLKNVYDYYKPDVITANELVPSARNANSIRDDVLNADGRTAYKRAKLTNRANSGIVNMLYYNTNKVGLAKQAVSNTELRDINHYKLYHKPDNLNADSDTAFFWVATMHLKAGGGASLRGEMAAKAMGYAQRTDGQMPYILTGDMNLQNAQEEAYQTFTDPPRSEWYRFYDPLDAEGYWHDNSRYADIFTQSTRTGNLCDGGASGGMDDRFDLILINEALEQNTSEQVTYVDGSYVTAGQDGKRQNGSITDPNNREVPGNVATSLKNFSDHLPIMLDLQLSTPDVNTDPTATAPKRETQLTVKPNPFQQQLQVSLPEAADYQKAVLYNATGQRQRAADLSAQQEALTWQTSNLKPGLYFLKVQNQKGRMIKKSLIKR
jgi:endonuclease/exonuclease/phosphatase family metal-dependent hydrolase